MDAKVRMGLVAGGIVAALALVFGGLAALVLLAYVVPAATTKKAVAIPTIPGGTAGGIASHPFWAKPLSDGQVKAVLAKLHALPADRAAFVDQTGAVTVSGDPKTITRAVLLELRQAGWEHGKPDGVSGRYFVYDTLDDATRPSEAEVSRRVLGLLERATFRP